MECWNFDILKTRRHFYYRDQKCWLPFYILGDYSNGSPVHTHDFIEITVIEKGSITHRRFLPGEEPLEQQLGAGEIIGFLPGERHEFIDTSNSAVLYNLDFSAELLKDAWPTLLQMPGLDTLLCKRQTLHASAEELDQILAAVQRTQEEFFHQQSGYEINLPGMLTDLLIKIGRIPARNESAIFNCYVSTAVQYIRRHYAQKISLDDIAHAAGVGRTYLCRLFKENMNMSVWDFVNKTRIEKAKFHIQTTQNITVYEIAAACGLEDSSYFARLFRKLEGISPRSYMQKLHEQISSQKQQQIVADNGCQRKQ